MADTIDPSQPDRATDSGRKRAPGSHPVQNPRGEVIRDPNVNQADDWRGWLDQTQGSQPGSDLDLLPEP